eukprot:9058201-Alexandrium_andersonii.AAC.1
MSCSPSFPDSFHGLHDGVHYSEYSSSSSCSEPSVASDCVYSRDHMLLYHAEADSCADSISITLVGVGSLNRLHAQSGWTDPRLPPPTL